VGRLRLRSLSVLLLVCVLIDRIIHYDSLFHGVKDVRLLVASERVARIDRDCVLEHLQCVQRLSVGV